MRPLRLFLLGLGLGPLAGCAVSPKDTPPAASPKEPAPETAAVNLFGFDESQIQWLHYNVSRRGRAVLARFDPKDPTRLDLLDCNVQGAWNYEESSGAHVEELVVGNEAALRAHAPLGVERLSSHMAAGSELTFRSVAVGAYHLEHAPVIPAGVAGCDGATHYVAALSVGAVEVDVAPHVPTGAARDVSTAADDSAGVTRGRGEHFGWGSVSACEESASRGCRTPVQLMLVPVATAGSAVGHAGRPNREAAAGALAEAASAATLSTDAPIEVAEEAWRPGHYMAQALSKLVSMTGFLMENTSYGLDGESSCILAGYLGAQAPMYFRREMTQGTAYAVLAAGAGDLDFDVAIYDADGEVVAQDRHDDSQPFVLFRPERTARYRVELSVAEGQGFAGIAVAVDDGFIVPTAVLRDTFQALLDRGTFASKMVRRAGHSGVVFLDSEGDVAIQATLMAERDSVTFNGIEFPADRGGVFVALTDDTTQDLDAAVREIGGGQEWRDTEDDGVPVIQIDPAPVERRVGFEITLQRAEKSTLGVSMVLLEEG